MAAEVGLVLGDDHEVALAHADPPLASRAAVRLPCSVRLHERHDRYAQDRPQHQSDGSRYRTDDEQDVYAVLFVRAEGVEAHGERVPGTCRHLGHRSWWLVPSAVPSGP